MRAFTERRRETGLDYFGARYFSAAQGRFTSPDWSTTPEPVPYANLADPQTLNLYSYVRNNPLSKTDSDGHCFWDLCIGEGYAAVAIVGAAVTTAAYLASPAGRHAITSLVSGVKKAADAIGQSIAENGIGAGTSETGSIPTERTPTPGEGSTPADPQGSKPQKSKPEKIADQIEQGGYQVQGNPKTGTQEGNVTISHPSEPGTRVNVRVETHPLKPGGPAVRHANVETVKPGPKNRPEVIDKKHIVQ